jgi:N utilization substance protein B
VISSRRLAREWALKILYQMDVGKTTPSESQGAALERLRREFVQRGSRTASGSRAEEDCLEWITDNLRDTQAGMRLPMERALVEVIGRLLMEVPYWIELRLERSFKNQVPGASLSPPRLLLPLTGEEILSLETQSGLSAEEQGRLQIFVQEARTQLPLLLEKELRQTGLARAKELAAVRRAGTSPEERENLLHTKRIAFNREAAERWRKVAQMVQKQTGDWLRVAAFTLKLVSGVHTHREEIDRILTDLSAGWTLERQAIVDRNIMRIAAFEMLHLIGIPASASINEAVELAKKYSTSESGRFVNGVLGALATKQGDQAPKPADAIESEAPDAVLDMPEIIDKEELEIE